MKKYFKKQISKEWLLKKGEKCILDYYCFQNKKKNIINRKNLYSKKFFNRKEACILVISQEGNEEKWLYIE